MKIQLDSVLRTDLLGFKKYIDLWDEENLSKNQEYVFSSLALLINPIFRGQITKWRRLHQIDPTERKKYFESGYRQWAMHQKSDPPQLLYDKRVVKLCKICNVDPQIYSNFVLDYLYYEEVMPVTANNLRLILGIDPSQHLTAKNEFRYKSRIVKDHGDMPTSEYTDDPQNLFIQIFGGTSQRGLINFITENWSIIKRLQNHLKPYPHAKKFEFFKRDIQVYLLHLLGYKPKDVGQIILNENVPEDESEERHKLEETYSLDEDRIYQIIEDINEKIKILIS